MATYTFQPSDFWDSRTPTDQGGYYNHHPLSRIVFTSAARMLTLTVNSTEYSDAISVSRIGIRVNGADYLYVNPGADGSYTFNLLLSRGQKQVEIVASGANKPSTSVLQTFLVSMDADAAFTVQPPQASNRLVIYGDSISVGSGADSHALRGWASLLRRIYPGSVLVEGHGFRKLQDDASTAGARTTMASTLAALNPSKLWIAIGTNDYGIAGTWNAASFGTAYADLLDKFHAAAPGCTIYCQSPIVRTTETANGAGSTLGNYRTQIETACSTRAWTTFVDGSTFMTTASLADGVHPNTAGHVLHYSAVRTQLGL